MNLFYDPAAQVEQADWLRRAQELDPELFEVLLNEDLYTKNGKLKVTRLAKVLGSGDKKTRERLRSLKELLILDLRYKKI